MNAARINRPVSWCSAHRRWAAYGAGAGLALMLAACGGGSGGDPGADTPAAPQAQLPAPVEIPSVPIPPDAASAPVGGGSGGNSATQAQIAGCPMFPEKAIFNTRIDDVARFPAHPQSANWVALVGSGTRLHADWGSNDNPQQYADYYGIPFNVVDGSAATTLWPTVAFSSSDPRMGSGGFSGYPDESDCAAPRAGGGYDIRNNCTTLAPAQQRFPFPVDALVKTEGGACGTASGACGGGDHHVLVVEQGACRLWESWYAYELDGRWYAGGTAAWDLRSYAQRPDSWTSADAAGLPILPLLARADEASTGEVKHPLRVTFRSGVMARRYVWPARHQAGTSGGGIPFGALLRLKAGFVIPSTWTPQAQALARAMQRYGVYVADNGSNLFVQGDPNSRWEANTTSQLQTITMAQFEFVDLSAVTSHAGFNADSLQASW